VASCERSERLPTGANGDPGLLYTPVRQAYSSADRFVALVRLLEHAKGDKPNMRRGTPQLTVDDQACSGANSSTGPDGGVRRKTGGGRVSAAAPFDKLTICAVVDGRVVQLAPWHPRPAGRMNMRGGQGDTPPYR